MSRQRSAFTLIELLATMTSASILVLGMTSTIYVALQSADSTSNQTTEGINALAEFDYDLTYAKDVVSGSATNLQILVADRDGDLADDIIIYDWRGVEGQPLTRTFNDEDSQTLIDSVSSLEFAFVENELKELIYIEVLITFGTRNQVLSSSFAIRNRP